MSKHGHTSTAQAPGTRAARPPGVFQGPWGLCCDPVLYSALQAAEHHWTPRTPGAVSRSTCPLKDSSPVQGRAPAVMKGKCHLQSEFLVGAQREALQSPAHWSLDLKVQ